MKGRRQSNLQESVATKPAAVAVTAIFELYLTYACSLKPLVEDIRAKVTSRTRKSASIHDVMRLVADLFPAQSDANSLQIHRMRLQLLSIGGFTFELYRSCRPNFELLGQTLWMIHSTWYLD
jgi:hypothetical protein